METLKNYNYYREQLDLVSQDSLVSPSLQISGGLEKTKWLDINTESAPILRKWLKQFEPQPTEMDKERDLYSEVDRWVNSNFNFIQLSVYERMSENMLLEYIRQPEIDLVEFLEDYNCLNDCSLSISEELNEEIEISIENIDDYRSEVEHWIEENTPNDFDNFKDQKQDANYPMWGTVFEFRHEPSEDIIEACINAGFGIIEGMEDFNTSLFVSGCGYSFYGAHWIPAYLGWNERAREDYNGIKYDHL